MRHSVRRCLMITVMASTLVGVAMYLSARADAEDAPANAGRTQLVFGTAKPDGTVVSEAEFHAFVDAQVTPRFPNGVIIASAGNLFRDAAGVIVKEDAFVALFLYPFDRATEAGRRINTVRRLYMDQFQQESVLRVDDALGVRVSF